jgi:acyl-CoA synthetase (AMP-forming)/AMP-acid ligase II
MNIATTLEQLALKHPEHIAIIEQQKKQSKSTSYAELNHQVQAVAAHFKQCGIKKGDIILLYVDISSSLYALLLGINRIGAVVLFIDPTYGPKEIQHCIELTKPQAIVVADRLQLIAKVVAPLFGIKKVFALHDFNLERTVPNSTGNFAAIAAVEDCHPALITFTSGSTALPKGIVRSHGFLHDQCEILTAELEIGKCQSELTTLPIFVLANLASGVISILPSSNLRSRFKLRQQRHSAEVARQILEHLPERVLAAPAFLSQVASYLKGRNLKCSFVKEVLTGGGPVFPQLLELLAEVFPNAQVITVYGSTEAEPIAHMAVAEGGCQSLNTKGAGLPQGKVSTFVDLAIVPDDVLCEYTENEFQTARGAANVVGEILVAGRHVIDGYIGAIGNSESKIRVGSRIFHRTGDAGYLDSNGNLFLVGRASMKIGTPGGSVYPLAVEASAMATGLLDSCAFLVVGNKRVLVAKLNSNAHRNSETILLQCLKFAYIDKVVIRGSIPMDKRHSSKILYKKLVKALT